jgi:hypothetical protein
MTQTYKFKVIWSNLNRKEHLMNDRKELKELLETLSAYDQAGGYVPLELDPDSFDKLADFITEQTRLAREEEIYDLDIWVDMHAKGSFLDTYEIRSYRDSKLAQLAPKPEKGPEHE